MKELTASQMADLLAKCRKVANSVNSVDQLSVAEAFFKLACKKVALSNDKNDIEEFRSCYLAIYRIKSKYKYC